MRIEALLKIIEDSLPPGSAMEGDRIGLQIEAGKEKAEKILLTLEINDLVIDEAQQKQTDCIITFHPLIYTPLAQISSKERVGKLTTALIKNSISVIAVHTNFDAFSEGTSKILADKLGMKVESFLQPDNNYENRGMGVIAIPPKELSPGELLALVSNVCKSPLRCSNTSEVRPIKKCAIVGGSGSSFIENALNSGADAFITADLSYHKFHQVDGRIMLIDPGHYEMEQFVPYGLQKLLMDQLKTEDIKSIEVSSVYTNPVRYYPETENYINMQKEIINNTIRVV